MQPAVLSGKFKTGIANGKNSLMFLSSKFAILQYRKQRENTTIIGISKW
jgi:hypothetical protein